MEKLPRVRREEGKFNPFFGKGSAIVKRPAAGQIYIPCSPHGCRCCYDALLSAKGRINVEHRASYDGCVESKRFDNETQTCFQVIDHRTYWLRKEVLYPLRSRSSYVAHPLKLTQALLKKVPRVRRKRQIADLNISWVVHERQSEPFRSPIGTGNLCAMNAPTPGELNAIEYDEQIRGGE